MENDNTLERLHQVLLGILIEFDRICRKHNIQYFLDSGTALGAVRHGGFIPWDDDIDVGMLRSEYDRFMEIAPMEIGPDFYLQHRGVDRNYRKDHAKLRKKGTFYPEKGTSDLICQGIFIDIFPFDYVSDGRLGSRIDFFICRYFKSRTRIRLYSDFRDNGYKKILGILLSILPEQTWTDLYQWSMTRLNTHETKHVTCYQYKMCIKRNLVFKKEWLSPSVSIMFESQDFLIMNDFDNYLKVMYGDYHALPPMEKRTFHCSGDIIF